ncbi:MAG: hypothetical protein M0Z39_05775 [Actinomycetota bacterium]|jgi:uncharacterized metal-binding protein|nr:hypothetical protein [Actinomycetota bacterium]
MADLVLILEVLLKVVYEFGSLLLLLACVIGGVIGVVWVFAAFDTVWEAARKESEVRKTIPRHLGIDTTAKHRKRPASV